MISFNS